MTSFALAAGYDHAKEVKEFDDSKIGVKGLVGAGATTIPRFFHHPASSLTLQPATTDPSLSIPTIDLSLPRPRAVELSSAAARGWGFFQVTNHGVPLAAISAALSTVQAFNELPTEIKAAHYTREEAGGVNFYSNFDLYRSDAACWRDTLQVIMAPTPPDTAKIPAVCRKELLAWDEHARALGEKVMGLLSEGLRVEAGRLVGLSCLDRRAMVCHYYPYCPQPELTLGVAGHTDPTVLTVLVQNEVEGLLVRKGDAEEGAGSGSGEWVMVQPVPGAIIINVGDMLQRVGTVNHDLRLSTLDSVSSFSPAVVINQETCLNAFEGVAGGLKDQGGPAAEGPHQAAKKKMTSFPLAAGYDHAKEVKEFDDSKIGVMGLVDAGTTTIPRFFHHPASSLTLQPAATDPSLSIPTIDLSLPRPRAVELASAAARDWGFFQVTNHGAPLAAISAALSTFQAFNELPTEIKAAHYTREEAGGVNFDLYRSDAASWRDTLQVIMAPTPPDTAKIPEVCRKELLAWDEHARALAERVMGLLSEGLGVEAGRLVGLSCLERRPMLCHYYPYCPQPELTLGFAGHTDPTVLTVLVQNEVEGLLVRKGDAEEGAGSGGGSGQWVRVQPVPGAIIINVGDMLQMMSNDEYKSVEHKVIANTHMKPRVSIATFYSPSQMDESTYFGPLKELVSQEKPARYRKFTVPDLLNTFFSTKLGSRSVLSHFEV